MNPSDYLVEFLSELGFEFPEDALDCIVRMVTGWHMLGFDGCVNGEIV